MRWLVDGCFCLYVWLRDEREAEERVAMNDSLTFDYGIWWGRTDLNRRPTGFSVTAPELRHSSVLVSKPFFVRFWSPSSYFDRSTVLVDRLPRLRPLCVVKKKGGVYLRFL